MRLTTILFKLARLSNLGRHTGKGTLPTHLVRKFSIKSILRALTPW